ncbi:MAG: ATP-binding protein [Chloroflexota bacterium]
MRQLVVLSGKGGTGKTSVAAAFAHLAHAGPSPLRCVLADADVDAPNIELLLRPRRLEEHEFTAGRVAVIDQDRCEACGLCVEACRFDAVSPSPPHQVDGIACEGCAACFYVCPEEAIQMQPQRGGSWFRSQTDYGPLFHAALLPGQENSGKLVTLVKQHARLHALDGGFEATLVDGPPGIGCPVISAISGADLALAVAEATNSGLHDLERALATTTHFGVPALACINRWDIDPDNATRIEDECRRQGVEVVGRIPFDPAVTVAMVQGEPVTVRFPEAPASLALAEIWRKVATRLNGAGEA